MLPVVQSTMNSRITARNKSTPFSLMFARPLNEVNSFPLPTSELLTEDQIQQRNETLIKHLYPIIHEQAQTHSAKIAAQFNTTHSLTEFPLGAIVMKLVDVRNSKNDAAYEGPFKITRKTEHGSYILTDNSGSSYPKTVSPSQLKLCKAEEVWTGEEFEVESIVNHKGKGANRQYQVKWRGYGNVDNTWEFPSNLSNATDAISLYWKKRTKKK